MPLIMEDLHIFMYIYIFVYACVRIYIYTHTRITIHYTVVNHYIERGTRLHAYGIGKAHGCEYRKLCTKKGDSWHIHRLKITDWRNSIMFRKI